ncbi:hypothetical protein ASPWEDRAFT_26940 [Aspergillus wentii DTO 134E9]|uniref:adenosine deaminase n=1 Tax=Aspergillus wentii DTO 134E9 TaxID=1073089 RepID=A0A1L9RRM6_ASPWE|nr:uncharacterized protein ASPWEDRAFT_26940 [Aspergillus wentii DTO 134E9]KAI9930411.1 hypothetical protein MW887_011165 [Aspergillus wentii]OJJ37569.1 hypothetical protein ASPWEDRAFT_26940 [Aspergillus wentii DTO 134E9]
MKLLGLVGVVSASLLIANAGSVGVDAEPPAVNSSVVQRHMLARDAMVNLEKRQRQDYTFKQNLSPTAQKADAITRAIRQEEIEEYWRKPAAVGDEENERFAGEMFPKARPLMLSTKLWKIVRRMPKGALLHSHLYSMLPFRALLDAAFDTPGMAVSASQAVSTADSQKNASISFVHINHTVSSGEPSISSDGYVSNTLVPLNVAAAEFPGGRENFTDFLMTKLALTPQESIRHELGVDEVWRVFENFFGPAIDLLSYEPLVRTFYKKLFARLVEDHINWVEIRTGAGYLVHEGQEAQDNNPDYWWDVLVDELNQFKNSENGTNFWGARVIWADTRSFNRSSITQSMKQAIGRKQKFPELFGGYDLVGQEDLGHSLAYHAPELIWFQEQTEKLNLTVPFFFHAGETLGDGNSTDLNLFDAILFNSRRIGHGFSLYKHPKLIDEVVDNGIMVEVCPISNEVLRLNTDILHHPLPAMIAHGIPTAISNDDPAMLGQNAPGLSFDFYEAIQGFDNLGLGGLGALAHNSLRWANFEDQSDADWIRDIDLSERGTGTKAKYIQSWNKQWEEFCEWIVNEYGDEYSTE